MESKSSSTKWNGFYELDESYGPILKGKKGFFEIQLTEDGNALSGTCKDTHGFGVHGERMSSIKGSVNGNQVSFVKKYDKAIPIDAFGSNVEGAHFNSEVHYSGTFNSERNKMSGHWRISISDSPESAEEFTTGNWEMTKE